MILLNQTGNSTFRTVHSSFTTRQLLLLLLECSMNTPRRNWISKWMEEVYKDSRDLEHQSSLGHDTQSPEDVGSPRPRGDLERPVTARAKPEHSLTQRYAYRTDRNTKQAAKCPTQEQDPEVQASKHSVPCQADLGALDHKPSRQTRQEYY